MRHAGITVSSSSPRNLGGFPLLAERTTQKAYGVLRDSRFVKGH